MSKTRKKQKKTRDLSKCCRTCSFASQLADGKISCGLDAVDVEPDSCCPRWGQEVECHCQRCGKSLKFRDKAEMFLQKAVCKIETGGGSTAQAFTLCRECSVEAQEKFGEFLDYLMAWDARR